MIALFSASIVLGGANHSSGAQQQTAPPAGTTTQPPSQERPGSLPPGQTELPPNSGTAPVRPDAEAQQSAQPQSNIDQQRQQTSPDTAGPQPVTPQVGSQQQQGAPGALPQTAAPAGTTPAGGRPARPEQRGRRRHTGSKCRVGSGIAPAELPAEPPPIAPNYRAPARALPSAERVGVDAAAQTPLTLNEAIKLALQNNNDIETASIDVRLAEFDLRGARGIYDPLISSESYLERSTTPTSSLIGGGPNGSVTQTDATGALRFGGFSPFFGGNYQIDFASTRLTTNNSFVSLNPQYPTALTFTYAQPLLRGLRIDDNRRRIEIGKRNVALTDAQFRQRAIEVIAQVEGAYWDLAFALRNLQVQIEAVKQARTQVESNQRLVQEGVLAPIDIVAADAQVTNFEQSVYSAQEGVTRAENTLKTLLLPDRQNQLWSQALVPVTPIDLEPPRLPLTDAVQAALVNRPELAQLVSTAEINQVNTRFYKDQTRPQLDLVGTYNPVGLGGSLVPRGDGFPFGGTNEALEARVNDLSIRAGLAPLPPTPVVTGTVSPDLIGSYGTSLGNLFGLNYPTVRFGVRVQLPLRNRTAEANFGRSLAEGTRIQNQRAQAEQIIEADVRNSLQAVRSAQARLASAAASRSSAEQQFASERRQFQSGLSTVFLVLQRQTELLAARGRELQAQTDLNKSIAQFQRSIGTTLEANRVSVRSDRPLRTLETAGTEAGVPVKLTGFMPIESGSKAKAS
ncbi:MAG: TolC family protein, partial [Pyrinomonadaceae bacterium]